MTKIASKPLRWASVLIAGSLLAGLSGCSTIDFRDFVDSGTASPSHSSSPTPTAGGQDVDTAAQAAAKECFPGIWMMDKANLSSVLVEAEILASKEIEGTALIIARADGTVNIEYIGWKYVINTPPNPILGDQVPKTTTISIDSSETGTYEVDSEGIITVTLDRDSSSGDGEDSTQTFTCSGNRLVEKVELLDAEVVYHRRSK